MSNIKDRTPRNDAIFDKWSIVHLISAAGLTFLFGPSWAFAITVLWEPLELFVLSPLLAKFGILFGHETIRNSLSDIIFDALGVLLAISILFVVA